MGQDRATIMELKSAIAQQRKQIEALTATVEKASTQITLSEGVKSLVNPAATMSFLRTRTPLDWQIGRGSGLNF